MVWHMRHQHTTTINPGEKNMRRVRANIFAAIALSFMAVCATFAAAADQITIVSWGGSYSDSQRRAFYQPFSKSTGVTVLEDEWHGDMAKVRTMVESRSYQGDVFDAESAHLVSGCDAGLWEHIDYAKLGFTPDDFLPGAASECGVGSVSWSTLFAFDADAIKGDGPQSWADFWDVRKYPGKRGLAKDPRWNLEFALLADGVPAADLYKTLRTDAGVARAFAKLDQIKPHVVWWEAGAEAPKLLANKEVVMTTGYNGRLYTAITEDKKNLRMVWNGQGVDFDYWVIPKGLPNLDLAYKFIAFASEPERMAQQTAYIAYGPLRKDALKFVAPSILPNLPTAPANTHNWFKSDTQFWADNHESLMERFNLWLSQ
jgi:putative spermidine/putrescine transport system substrate-binding protein